MKANIKAQIKLLFITLAQTVISVLAILSYLPVINAWSDGWNDPMLLKVFVTVGYFLLLSLPIYILSYIPAKYVMREKGRLLGNTTVDSVYYNTKEDKIKIKSFSDFAEYKPKYTVIWTLISPLAFLFQLVAVIMAFVAEKSDRIYSKLGMKSYSTLENPKLQEIYNFLFNFVVFPKTEEKKPEKKAEASAPVASTAPETDDDGENEESDDIVTLTNAEGKEVDFVEIAGIAHGGNFYAILQPVELLEGMDDDEALVFKVKRGADGEDKFEIELDDEIIDAVFAEYNRLLDAEASK